LQTPSSTAHNPKKSDPSILRDKLFQKIGFLTERITPKNPIFSKNRIFDGAHNPKKSDFFKKSDF
jgi:hypothetical protein